MKRSIKLQNLCKQTLMLLVMLALRPQLASAHDFEVDGIYYNINGNNATVTYKGSDPYLDDYSGAVNVPSTVTYNGTTYSVTEIGGSAFYECSGLTLVTLPNSVTTIGEQVFRSCTGLTSITIPNSVTSIGDAAFYGCGLTSVTIPNSVTSIGDYTFTGCSGLTSVTIPNSVTSIGDGAFSFCEVLTSVTIPNSVTSIGVGAFYECSGLTSVTIPNSVTSIGDDAFAGCCGLTSVTIPNSVTSIGDLAFYYCSSLTSIEIPNSVTSIGDYVFDGCSGLTSVTIPSSVTSIGNYTFSNCMSLTSIIVESGNTKYDSRDNCNAIIETGTNTLTHGCKNTIIPNSVTSIGDGAFAYCTGLTSVTIPNSVTSIGENAYRNCSGLTSMTIPNSVTSIDDGAFAYCTGLTSVTIPNSVTSIGVGAFYECSGLTSVTLTGNGAWYDMPSFRQAKTVNIGSGITSLGNFGFAPDVVNCYTETPPACSYNTFANYDGALHVPTTSIASYFMADYWQNFNNMVNDLNEKVALDKSSASLVQWETLALTATVSPEADEVIWSTTNSSVATVDVNGKVTAVGEGECDIYVTLTSNPAVYAWCHITVSYPEITLLLSEESLEMNVGDEQALTITITPDNTGLTPTWSSSNTSVASVNYNGVITAVGEGECDITATVLDQTVTCHVTVSGNVILTLNIENAIMGASQILTVYPSCSPDLPVELVVTSSDPSVALARVVNRTNAPSVGLKFFPEKGMALALMEKLSAPSESKVPELASTKAIMIVGVQNGTATITVTTADGKAEPAVLYLRVVDVDGDRTVTASDITSLYNYLLSGDNTHVSTSDVNGDGSITSADITAIYNLILGN